MSFTPEDHICRFEHVIKLERARAEYTEDLPAYQHRHWQDEVEEKYFNQKKEKEQNNQMGMTKKYPGRNITLQPTSSLPRFLLLFLLFTFPSSVLNKRDYMRGHRWITYPR
jgi:hypothetical protein